MEAHFPIIVVGAGLTGLRCAQSLRMSGNDVVVLERSDDVGGRLRSRRVDGYVIDEGFQLVNPSYPELVATGILDTLDLRAFEAAVEFHHAGRVRVLTDPRHAPLDALKSLGQWPVTSLARLGLLMASTQLASASRIAVREDLTTREGLRRAGLNEDMIDTVMRPFLRGALLDDELTTSWAFSQLLLKSFGRGRPSTHPDGIGAIAHALAARSGASIRLNADVTHVEAHAVEVNGERIECAAVVVATDANDAARLTNVPRVNWQRQLCWWWSTPTTSASARLHIDLDDALTTSALDLSAVAPERAPTGMSLIATPSNTGTTLDEARARESVAKLYNLDTRDVALITVTDVPRALPHVAPPFRARRDNTSDGVILAGDYLTSSSIQGALVSGRRAATSVRQSLRGR